MLGWMNGLWGCKNIPWPCMNISLAFKHMSHIIINGTTYTPLLLSLLTYQAHIHHSTSSGGTEQTHEIPKACS